MCWLLHREVLCATIFQGGFSQVPYRISDSLRRSVQPHILPLFFQRCSQKIRKSFSLVLHLGDSAINISSRQRLQPSPSYFNNKHLFFIKALSSIWPIYFSKEELIIGALHSVYEREHKHPSTVKCQKQSDWDGVLLNSLFTMTPSQVMGGLLRRLFTESNCSL